MTSQPASTQPGLEWFYESSIPLDIQGLESWRFVQNFSLPLFIQIISGHAKFLPDDKDWIELASEFKSSELFVSDFGWVQVYGFNTSSFSIHMGRWVHANHYDFAEANRLILKLARKSKTRFIYAYLPDFSVAAIRAALKNGFQIHAKYDQDKSFRGSLRDMLVLRLEVPQREED
jgi:hypothetical protein